MSVFSCLCRPAACRIARTQRLIRAMIWRHNMRSRFSARNFGVVGLMGLGVIVGTLSVRAQVEMVAAGKAQCGPGSQPETGLQGTTTQAERFAAPRAYTCNVELTGQEVLEGTSWGAAFVDRCAIVGRNLGPISGKD